MTAGRPLIPRPRAGRFRLPARILLAAAGLCLTAPAPAGAQILNTLRGFQANEIGWSGQVEGTAAVAAGNTEYLELELGAGVQFQTDRHRWRLLGKAMRRTASGTETAESRTAHLRHNYRLRPWLATVAFVQGQHDPFRRIQTRILLGGGLRFDLLRGAAWQGAVGATVMREDERLTGTTRFDTTARGSFFLSVLRKGKEGLDVDVTGFFQPALDDFGDLRALLSASLGADLVGNLYFRFRYGLEVDTDPAPGVKETDHLIRSGLGVRL